MKTESSSINWPQWLSRWDAQQTGYLPHREARFQAMLDALAVLMPEEFVAVDLASGPGAVSQRLLGRFPKARCVAVDIDPVLLALGQGSLGDMGGRLRWVEADLMTADLPSSLGEPRVDAVLTTTALHWLPSERLIQLYRQLGQLVRPGGVVLNGDNIPFSRHLGSFQRLADTVKKQQQADAFERRGVEDWSAWWSALSKEPGMGALMAERERRFARQSRASAEPLLDLHEAGLSDAGFGEVSVIWQHMDDRVVMAVR
jgi:trans-aconitate methyltransferase